MLRATIKFARVRIVVTCLALVLLGSIAAGGLALPVVTALLLVVLVNIHANSINDYTDRHIDRVNLKGANDRPFVSGTISMLQFWIIHSVSAIAILILSLQYELPGIVASLTVLLIDYTYSLRPLRLSDHPLIAPVILSCAYVLYSFTFGFWSYQGDMVYPVLLVIGLIVGFIARLLLKDFRDIAGDSKYHKTTFLIRFGPRATVATSGILFSLAMGIVSWSFGFYLSTTVALLLCGGMSCWLLWRLFRADTFLLQQHCIIHIARLANIAIIVIMVYLLCRNQEEIADITRQSIILIIGCVLSGRVLVNYFLFRPSERT